MAIGNELYPPIVPSTIPAFVRTDICKFYFSLSAYNSAASINHVQLSIVNQKTNVSALRPDLYPSGIKITQLKKFDPDESIVDNYQYYI